ncbi:broad specificity phosphatase PhoE [Rhodopseudomonas thermotolerans]|uniref:Broad specificity phosphatase PhoE n=2 Tax=Rhodopseudomonas TaxID=1073 RepID=A0A336JT99_9BRAD|nr:MULTISPECIES: histidine phosphatase family protein [Rhodopseudomonas]RED33253.1 broad specificity phosphatase PhoE [Rhodopseudomonas pentothenatexigens]REF94002.1 broad specificity phosphatase PhoE [Rhodopseudomonas thermotolerans]SSW91329.1 broad specificity phosphatase PhoE [Rhodopseudomonas pentothenatexigens]
MVKRVHLVRHGHHGQLGRLCGRMSGVALDDLGQAQMRACAAVLAPAPDLIESSPRLRTRQSALFLAAHFRLPVRTVAAFDELDVGDWTGSSFEQLDSDPRWRQWNARRGSTRPPRGESMAELQRRVVQHLETLRRDGSDSVVAIVSHAEPIRAALLHYAGVSVDDFSAVPVEPASISTLATSHDGFLIEQINRQVPL